MIELVDRVTKMWVVKIKRIGKWLHSNLISE